MIRFLIPLLIFCAGCAQKTMVGRSPATIATPSGVLTTLALIATGLSGAGLLAAALLAWFYPDKRAVLKLAIACTTVLLGAQIIYWLGAHLALAAALSVVALLVGGGLWLWVHRMQVESALQIDLDRDGKIG